MRMYNFIDKMVAVERQGAARVEFSSNQRERGKAVNRKLMGGV
jgi:hypothetical protein